MNFLRYSLGFTLVELLIVVSIIGILVAMVVNSLNDARGGGVDASAKQTLASLRAQAELIYNSGGYSYVTVCDDAKVTPLLVALVASTPADTSTVDINSPSSATNVACHDDAVAYAVSVPMTVLKNGVQQYFCVDSTGMNMLTENELADSELNCT